MRPLTRLGVAAAATALASTTALAGAGVAGAQDYDVEYNSNSSVSVSGKGANTEVTYANRSGEDLFCSGLAGSGTLLADMYAFLRTGADPYAAPPAELNVKLLAAMARGQIGSFMGIVADGDTTRLSAVGEGGGAVLTDGSFTPAALMLCESEDGEYMEIEISAGAGVPAGLGSLDGALAGVGSSGSVARTTGSLGS